MITVGVVSVDDMVAHCVRLIFGWLDGRDEHTCVGVRDIETSTRRPNDGFWFVGHPDLGASLQAVSFAKRSSKIGEQRVLQQSSSCNLKPAPTSMA